MSNGLWWWYVWGKCWFLLVMYIRRWSQQLYMCVFTWVYYWKLYSLTLNDCDQDPCMNNATCVNDPSPGSYSCSCLDGFTGSHCKNSLTLPDHFFHFSLVVEKGSSDSQHRLVSAHHDFRGVLIGKINILLYTYLVIYCFSPIIKLICRYTIQYWLCLQTLFSLPQRKTEKAV